MKYCFLLCWVLGAIGFFPAALSATPESIRVSLFSPYRLASVAAKTGSTPARLSRVSDGAAVAEVPPRITFQLSAMPDRVRVSGLPGGRPDILVAEIHLESAGPEPAPLELAAPPLSPQQFKGAIRVRADRGQLLLIERTRLEDYLYGVVLSESMVERSSAALQAQAIASRTFAVKNGKRHGREGYDLCSSTHCQVYKGYVAETHPVAVAVRATAGMVLHHNGQLIDAYYSANCGGQTAAVSEIWPDGPPAAGSGVRDDYCQGRAHSFWRFRIAQRALWKALQSDGRTDPGSFLHQICLLSHGPSGRITRVAIEGERRRVIDGWAFRQVLARALGWGSIKSTLFAVTTHGPDFLFEGRGLGHGVGLCQAGAEAMAQRGFTGPEILRHYYPDARIHVRQDLVADAGGWTGVQGSRGRVRSSEHFSVKFTDDAESGEIDGLLSLLESIREGYRRRTGQAPDAPTEVIVHSSSAAFSRATGRPWWVAAVTGSTIEIQPVRTLKARGVLQSTLRHEYAHILINRVGSKPPPLWLAEGFSIHLAGEGERLRPPVGDVPAEISEAKLDEMLRHPADKSQMQIAYYMAYQRVKKIIARQGEESIWSLLRSRP